jgi:hypothetical protein
MYKTLSIFFIIIVSKHIYVLAAFLSYRLFIFVSVFFSITSFSHLSDMKSMYMYSFLSLFWLTIDWKHQKRTCLFLSLLFVYHISTCNFKISLFLFLLLYYMFSRHFLFCFFLLATVISVNRSLPSVCC